MTGNNRPKRLGVKFGSVNEKFNVLRKAKKLKNNVEIKNVYIDIDKTKEQRHEDFQLRQELRTKNRAQTKHG